MNNTEPILTLEKNQQDIHPGEEQLTSQAPSVQKSVATPAINKAKAIARKEEIKQAIAQELREVSISSAQWRAAQGEKVEKPVKDSPVSHVASEHTASAPPKLTLVSRLKGFFLRK